MNDRAARGGGGKGERSGAAVVIEVSISGRYGVELRLSREEAQSLWRLKPLPGACVLP